MKVETSAFILFCDIQEQKKYLLVIFNKICP